MSKRKILTLALSLCMVAILAVGGTLAYFTDADQADNVFTVGNVKIDLIEQQRKENEKGEKTTELEDFAQNKHLYPLVGSVQQDNKDATGLPTSKNYVDKIVTIENTGSEAAWIRAYFAIPSALDDGYDTFNAGLNVLHFNFGNKKNGDDWTTTAGKDWIWMRDNGDWKYFETYIGGIRYNVYFADTATPIAAGATTEQFVNGVYLDSTFDYTTKGQAYIVRNNEKRFVTLDKSFSWEEVSCPVFAVAVQAAGFDSADAAVTQALDAQYNPWGGEVYNWH